MFKEPEHDGGGGGSEDSSVDDDDDSIIYFSEFYEDYLAPLIENLDEQDPSSLTSSTYTADSFCAQVCVRHIYYYYSHISQIAETPGHKGKR